VATSTEIFDNAIDSLEHGIAHYLVRSEHPTAIKHAILTLYHSIELFLKERLARVHPILIYRDIDKPITEDSQTVGLEQALGRLANLQIGLSADHCKTIRDLQKRRNTIEHHKFDPSVNHEAQVGQAIQFLLEFLPEHLDVELREFIDRDETYRDLLDAALSFKDRVARARKEAEATGNPVVQCPECGEDALTIDPSHVHYCYYCHTDLNVECCDNCGRWVHDSEVSPTGTCTDCQRDGFGRS